MNNFTIETTETSTLKDSWYWFETTDGSILEFVRLIGTDDTENWNRQIFRMNDKMLQVCTRKSNGEGFYRVFVRENEE